MPKINLSLPSEIFSSSFLWADSWRLSCYKSVFLLVLSLNKFMWSGERSRTRSFQWLLFYLRFIRDCTVIIEEYDESTELSKRDFLGGNFNRDSSFVGFS